MKILELMMIEVIGLMNRGLVRMTNYFGHRRQSSHLEDRRFLKPDSAYSYQKISLSGEWKIKGTSAMIAVVFILRGPGSEFLIAGNRLLNTSPNVPYRSCINNLAFLSSP